MDKGILSIELIKAIWKEHKGDHDQLNEIIKMMILFDLICEIPDRPDGVRCIQSSFVFHNCSGGSPPIVILLFTHIYSVSKKKLHLENC